MPCFKECIPQGLKQLVCKFCSKNRGKNERDYFWCTADLLDLHIKREHNREMLFCQQCGMYYSSERTLRRHRQFTGHDTDTNAENLSQKLRSMKDHKKPDPHLKDTLQLQYKCDLCNHLSTSRGALILHKEFDHPMVRLKCGLCDLIFNSNLMLSKHLESVHHELPLKKSVTYSRKANRTLV